MHIFRTDSDIRIDSGGTQKLDHYVKGLCANKRISIITDKGMRGLEPFVFICIHVVHLRTIWPSSFSGGLVFTRLKSDLLEIKTHISNRRI